MVAAWALCLSPVASSPTESLHWGMFLFPELGLGLGAQRGLLSVPGDLPLFTSWESGAGVL